MLHLPTLLLQIAVILAVSRMVGWIFRKIHQRQVIGEMVAGILLGPSLLGWLAPNVSAALFPPASLGFLSALSQIGLLVFMFLIGLELDPQTLRGQSHTAVVTGQASIILPFLLGSLLSLYLYPRLSDDSVSFINFTLFMGTAMSITAFPVLARILTERNLQRTPLGIVTIACAAVNDVTAWCILAGVVLLVRTTEEAVPLWMTLLGSLGYIALMILGVRRLLTKFEVLYRRRGTITQDMLAVMLLLVLASGWTTEWLGIHALFGAFLVGAIMPKQSDFVHALIEKLNDLAVVLLLPLFFAFTGLRISVGLLNGGEMWFYFALILLAAIIGKFGGSTLAARATGQPWRESSAIGILMNTRGLVELVALNIGYDIGVISPTVFTMLVLMALITTFMTSPLLELFYLRRLRLQALRGAEASQGITVPPSAETLAET